MRTTRQVLASLAEANPGKPVTEDKLRSVLRRGEMPPPTLFAGRYLWTTDDLARLAACLKLHAEVERATASAATASVES